jgi:butyrate response factor 1
MSSAPTSRRKGPPKPQRRRRRNKSAPPPKKHDLSPKPIKKALYKTEKCRQGWMHPDRCTYGDRCQFAHSKAELRPRNHGKNYRTTLCRNYERDGNCPYGSRCRFIHRDDVPVENATPVPIPTTPPRIPMGKTGLDEAARVYIGWVRKRQTAPPPAEEVLQNSRLNLWMQGGH